MSPDGQWIAVSRSACAPKLTVVHNLQTGADRSLDAVGAHAIGWSLDSKLLEVSTNSGISTYDIASGHLVVGPVAWTDLKTAIAGERPWLVSPAFGGGVVSIAPAGDRSSQLVHADVLRASGGSSSIGNTIKSLGTYPLLADQAALDRSGSHLLLTGYTDHTWSELEKGRDAKPFDKPPLGLYAASDGKLRKIAAGQYTWVQWLPDDVALSDTTTAPSTPTTTTTTSSPKKSLAVSVTGCPATFGYSTAPAPVVPPTVSVSIGSADAKVLSGYSDGPASPCWRRRDGTAAGRSGRTDRAGSRPRRPLPIRRPIRTPARASRLKPSPRRMAWRTSCAPTSTP